MDSSFIANNVFKDLKTKSYILTGKLIGEVKNGDFLLFKDKVIQICDLEIKDQVIFGIHLEIDCLSILKPNTIRDLLNCTLQIHTGQGLKAKFREDSV
jgi:hypothetical protein